MNYRYSKGDKVTLNDKPMIVEDRYYPNGYGFPGNDEAYTVYPPGKKHSFGYHVWCWAKDLSPRV